MKVTTKLVGGEDVIRAMKAMGEALTRETLVPIMEDKLQPMADDMRSHARRRTGRLADSVTVSTELSPAQSASHDPIAPIEVFVGPGALPEAVSEEFGNFRQEPHPFIAPAFDSGVAAVMRGIAEDGVDAILKAGKRR